MLQKNKNGIYYFRYIIPKDIRSVFKSNEVLKSLKTKNKKQADIQYNEKLKELERIIYYIRSRVISEDEIEVMINDFKKNEITRFNKIYTEHPDPGQLYNWYDFDENIKIFKEYIYFNDYSKIDEIILDLLNKFDVVDYTTDEYEKIGKQICLTYCGLNEYMDSLIQGKIKIDNPNSLLQLASETIFDNVNIISEVKNKVETENVGVSLGECWDIYIDYKTNTKKVSKSAIKQYESARKYLSRFYEDSTDIGIFTKKIFRDLQQTFLKLPTKACSNKKYMDMKIEELIELDVDKLNNKTINGKFIVYKDLFNHLKYIEIIKENIVEVRKLQEEESSKVKYSNEDLKKIFNSSIDEKYKELCKIALYSGLRIGEICLLKVHNIVTIDDDLYIEIKRGDTKTKTKNAIRTVPIHSEIQDIILKYKNNAKSNYLLYDGDDSDEDSVVRLLTKKINLDLHNIVADKNKTFHSFRKNTTSKLYETSPTQESFIKVLMGHSISNNITLSVYGDVNLKELTKMINKLEFDLA